MINDKNKTSINDSDNENDDDCHIGNVKYKLETVKG
jgi:hypothetical protein